MENNKDNKPGKEEQHPHKSGNAANIDSIITSATGNVRSRMSSDSLASTGTNTSYEGPTAPGGGGSAGTGYTSGQSGTGAHITTDSDTAYVHGETDDAADETVDNEKDTSRSGRREDSENDTIGNP